jgi:hypothetical protein
LSNTPFAVAHLNPSPAPQAYARVIRGPWGLPTARLEGQAFEALTPEQQTATLSYALHDLARYQSELSEGERGWLLAQLGPGPVRVELLSAAERARVAGVALLVLRRRAGWAA